MNANKMAMVMDTVDGALHDPSTPWCGPLAWAEARTGVRRFKLLLGLLLTVSFYLARAGGAAVVADAVTFTYPACATVASTARPRPASAAKWCTYWMAFVVVQMVRRHVPLVPALVPHYHALQTSLLAWCSAPVRNNGSAAVNRFLGRRLAGKRR